ncbi:type I DNA topoisomerase [Faecalibacter sp. LW9]|uniref:type I DNA topoisomerase n=1 Tax=Faecalibacter sp. LW9 TaxID=3103144 RepID=UPI002AFEC66C|nr:type I DNA topoisomerase [Faecalibacter sp. LW9]
MSKNLVIVESPAKAKTIQGFLGKDFIVESSFGHVVDLPKKGMGIEIENDYKPLYEVTPDKKDVVNKLKKLSDKAETIWLASDEDREGEAISWHLYNVLGLDKKDSKRIVFNEITKKAIQRAVENPRQIDVNLVDAQQARRVLDRLVGFEMSPILWKKVKPGLSAGRVQSVSVRLIVEREKEIQNFNPTSSYRFTALFSTAESKQLKAVLTKEFETLEEAEAFLNTCIQAEFKVKDLQKKPAKRTPSAPFTTSTLQQEASRKLGFSVSRTMRFAQQLYEQGHITYMRTDSVNLSDDALTAVRTEIESAYGNKYVEIRKYANKNTSAQEAHEAIRPTHFENHTINVTDDSMRKLYELIWKRTVASQMANAELERTIIDIENQKNDYIFQSKGEVIVFDGFLKVYQESHDDEDADDDKVLLPKVTVGEVLNTNSIQGIERYSKAPARYTEASLVKKLEELGIGRPSTYAPTISTIQNRGYVEVGELEGKQRQYHTLQLVNDSVEVNKATETYGADRRKLMPTDIGIVVNDFLVDYFKNVMNYDFTARVEQSFDNIAEGKVEWTTMIDEFYQKFHSIVVDVQENAERASGERDLGVDPTSGKAVHARIGRYGPMIQIGDADDEDKRFASLQKNQSIHNISLEEALKLFELPKTLGEYKGFVVEVNNGRFGPYVKFDDKYISVPKDIDPLDLSFENAVQLIEEKLEADAPIAQYEGHDVTKGKGRFGPFIKWNEWFINVPKKYDFDHLSQADIIELIEDKKRKESERVVREWSEQEIRLEKARWGRYNLIHGKIKVEMSKETNPEALTLADVEKIIADHTPVKKAAAKKTATKKTTTAKKTTKKK